MAHGSPADNHESRAHDSVQEYAPPLNIDVTGVGGIEVEDQTDSSDESYDSGLDSGVCSSTTSVSSSVYDYTYSNGRRYHADRYEARYFLPNDDEEQNRLDLFHHVYLLLLGGKLFLAPLENPHRVLDLGTGTGIWAIDMAFENPESEVTGNDISPIQPRWVPSNCKFEIDDLEQEWTYKQNHFDFIHIRSLIGCFSNWDVMIQRTFDHLKPGGFLEYQDYGYEGFLDNGTPITGLDTPLARFLDLTSQAAEIFHRPLTVAKGMKDRMVKAGFVDITETIAIAPIGPWPRDKELKKLGKWGVMGLLESLETFSVALLTKALHWEAKDVEKLCQEVRADMRRGSKNKYYFQVWFIYGKKPELPEKNRPHSSK